MIESNTEYFSDSSIDLKKLAEAACAVSVSLDDLAKGIMRTSRLMAYVLDFVYPCPYCGVDMQRESHGDIPGAPDTCPNCGGWL